MPLAEATAIGFAKSFFVTIAAIIILKEKVGPRRWIAVLIGFFGVIIMVQPGTDGFNIISLYALTGSASAGLVMVIIRKLSQTDTPTTILTYQAIAIGVLVAIPAWYYWTSPSLNEWILLIAIGIISYGAQMLNVYAYKWGKLHYWPRSIMFGCFIQPHSAISYSRRYLGLTPGLVLPSLFQHRFIQFTASASTNKIFPAHPMAAAIRTDFSRRFRSYVQDSLPLPLWGGINQA